MNFVKTKDLSVNSNYDYVKDRIDLEGFMDLLIANIYYCNTDWPNNNVKFWRCKGDTTVCDGKWRWMMYDTDWGFGYNYSSQPECDLFKKASTTGIVGKLFTALSKNEQFRTSFLSRFRMRMKNNFEPGKVVMKIDSVQALLAPEMPDHINRWRAIPSYDQWLENIEVLRDFARRRPAFQESQLNVLFGTPGSAPNTGRK
jgi:hypothetical protein